MSESSPLNFTAGPLEQAQWQQYADLRRNCPICSANDSLTKLNVPASKIAIGWDKFKCIACQRIIGIRGLKTMILMESGRP